MPSAKSLLITAGIALVVVVAHDANKQGKLPLPKITR
jgi:hypothetical protein